MVALRGTDIVRVSLAEAVSEPKLVSPERYAESALFFGCPRRDRIRKPEYRITGRRARLYRWSPADGLPPAGGLVRPACPSRDGLPSVWRPVPGVAWRGRLPSWPTGRQRS